MPAPTKSDIINQASHHLGEEIFVDPLTDTSPTAETLRFQYDFSRRSALRSHTWSCAKTDVSLSADATAPTHTWARRFLVPQESIRVVNVNNTDLDNLYYREFEIKGQYIHTDESAPLKITYIKDEEDTSLFDALLVEAIAYHISFSACVGITDDKGLAQFLEAKYKDIIKEAKFIDSTHTRRPVDNAFEYSNWNTAHYGGGE